MLYTLCNKLISKAEISRVPWKNIPYYSPWSTEEKVEALVFLSKYWQLSALLMKIFWNSQLRALYRLAPGKGQPRSVGANCPSYLNSFFPGTIGTKRLDTTMTIVRSLGLRSQHRHDWRSWITAQLLFIVWLLSYNCSNYYPYAAHPFLPLGWSSVMITSSKSSNILVVIILLIIIYYYPYLFFFFSTC